MLEEQKQASLTLPDNQDDISVLCCEKTASASAGPQIVEITSDEDDDEDIGKSPPDLQRTVKHVPPHKGQKRICIRVPEQPAVTQVHGNQTDFVRTTVTQTSNQATLNHITINQQIINEPTLNQIPLIESTLSQPTFSQTSLCQTSPSMIDSAYSAASQNQQFQADTNIHLDVKPSDLLGDDGLTDSVITSFAQDLNAGKFLFYHFTVFSRDELTLVLLNKFRCHSHF